jgi:hypothetical protein
MMPAQRNIHRARSGLAGICRNGNMIQPRATIAISSRAGLIYRNYEA